MKTETEKVHWKTGMDGKLSSEVSQQVQMNQYLCNCMTLHRIVSHSFTAGNKSAKGRTKKHQHPRCLWHDAAQMQSCGVIEYLLGL